MKPKTFRLALACVILAGLLFTAAHIAWAWYAYEHASIIKFIAGEIW